MVSFEQYINTVVWMSILHMKDVPHLENYLSMETDILDSQDLPGHLTPLLIIASAVKHAGIPNLLEPVLEWYVPCIPRI